LLLEVPLGAIELAVAATGAPPGRFEPIEAGQPFGVIVDYAHTPGGIAAVLASARPLASGRILCVFGAGGDRDQAKRPLMGAAAEAGADRLYITSDNSRSEPTERIVGEILGGLERPADARVEHDRRRAIGLALSDAEEGDLVLILGKGHEQGQDIAGVVEPFDDRSVAEELLGGGG
jgi:UDP-N-acetylmuramoyl-L-alanyl-D-glutamate--2,6-diaminopimelate ligase